MTLTRLTAATLMLACATSVVAQPTSYTQWLADGRPTLTFAPGTPGVNGGALTVFTDNVSFQAAVNNPLASEDFEGGLVAAGGVATCTEPVSSASNDACYTPGDLIDGFSVASSLGGGVVTLGDGLIPQPTVVIGANTFTETTDIRFTANNIDAVAFDVMSGGANPILVSAFDAGDTLIGTAALTLTGVGTPSFIGVTSPTPIARINIQDTTDGGEVFDNLQFGQVNAGPPPVPQIVPTLGIIATVLLVLLMAGVAWRTHRRQSV